VLITVVWSGVVSLVAYKIVDMTIGLRVNEEDEREGLDISAHGETAYSRCSNGRGPVPRTRKPVGAQAATGFLLRRCTMAASFFRSPA